MKNILFFLSITCWTAILGQFVENDSTFNTVDTGFGRGDGANSDIFATAYQPDTKILIGGGFMTYNGFPANRIARLTSTGALDTSFNIGSGPDGTVSCITLQPDGKILVGGAFYNFNGLPAENIVRLNTDGSIDFTFNAGIIANNSINDILLRPNGKMVISGYFALSNGNNDNRIAQLNANGTLDLTFTVGFGPDNQIIDTKLQTDGKVVIAGSFTTFNGVSRNGIARLNVNGTLDPTFNPGTGCNGGATSLAIQSDGKILLAGFFTAYDTTNINNLVRINNNGTIDTTFSHNLSSSITTIFWIGRPNILLQPDSKIVIAGPITISGNPNHGNVFRLLTNGAIDLTFQTGMGFTGYFITKLNLQADGKILFACSSCYYNDTLVNNLTRLNTNGTLDYFNLPNGTGANSTAGSFWWSSFNGNYKVVNVITLQPDGKILIGGSFGYYNGVSKNHLARLHVDGTLDTTFNTNIGLGNNLNFFNTISCITLQSDGKILVGGYFQSLNGIIQNGIIRLLQNGSIDTTFVTSSNYYVGSISIQTDGKIIVGQNWVGTGISPVCRLNTDGSLDTTFNSSSSFFNWGTVFDTEIQPDGKILVGGNFQLPPSGQAINITRLNSDGSTDTTFNPGLGADYLIYDLILQPNGQIIAAGYFSAFDSVPMESIAKLNGNGSLDTSFNTSFGAQNWTEIETISLQADGKIIIGGNFLSFGGNPISRLARINTDGSFDTAFVTGSGFNGYVHSTAIQTDGKILVGGDFTGYNGIGRNRIARIIAELPDATVSLNHVIGQDICENRLLNLAFTVKNLIGEGNLPLGTPVSFFANDSIYISTVFTNDSISIGDSLIMSAMVNIPMAISSPFTLSIIANQDSTQLGVIGELNLSNNNVDTLITLNEIFIPTFDSIAPVCQGTNVVLPTTSTNGIAGTWSPAFNNQATTTYLFIPSDTNCIDSVLLSVQIVPSTLPTFSLADSICASGTLVLPTVSTNGFQGTWSPSFDNQNSATYTFTPDSINIVTEDCPISTQHAVVIVPQTIPSFSFTDSLCIGTSFVLPNLADNGILGVWSAAFNNQITTSYTFSPSAVTIFNACAANVNQTITIIPTLTPTFTIADSMCADVVFALPTSSIENVLGTWLPVFDNQASQNYSFTSNSTGIVNTNVGDRCPLSANKTITIVPRTTPTFTLLDSICIGASLVLPATSDNSIVGSWSPGFNNQVTTSYIFSPTTITVATGCPESVQETVIVDPFVDPVFTSIDSICQGNIVTLPTISENFINGSWSPMFDNQSTTTYTFTPSDPGCISSAQMTVPVFPLIIPSFSLTDSICQGDTLVFPITSDNSISGTWSPALNNQQTTTYTFTPNANECAVAAQWTIQVAPRITPSFSLPDTICQSEILVLPLISDNTITGTWSPTFNNQQTTNYTFIRNAFECASDVNYTLVVMPTSLTFDTLIYCENDLPFTWHGQILTSSVDTTTTLQDQYGCDSVVNLSFQVIPILYSSFNAEVCANELPFIWAGQSYNQTGSYNQTFTAQTSCDSVVTLNLIVRPAPIADFSIEAWVGCLPLEIGFVNNQVATGSSYLWNFGNGQTSTGVQQVSAMFTQAGCYDVQLTATNIFGCTSIQNQASLVCIDPNPIAAFSPQINPLPLVNPTTLLQNNSTDAYSYFWSFGDGTHDYSTYSPIHTFPEQAGSYSVTLLIENQNGCQDSSAKTIFVEQDPLFYVPNAFSPDGNEFNNVFKPVFADNLVLSQFEMKIYNRWGELVFLSQDQQVGWDGTYEEKPAPDGAYTYSLLFKEAGFARDFQAVGSLMLVR